MSKIMSSSSDSSSDDECSVYVNAAFKLNALNNQKRGNRSRINLNDDVNDNDNVNTNESERLDLTMPPISVVESISNNDSTAAKVREIVPVEGNCEKDPVISIDDADDCYVVNESTPTQTTRNSRKRNAPVPERLPNSESLNDLKRLGYSKSLDDSIEEELNKAYDDSFNLSQEDNDNCVMIGSPELKRNNSDNSEVTIKVLWKSDQCQRFELGKYETFQKVFKSLAELESISENQVLITKKDKRITPFDTPASIGWSILDILEGGVVSADLVKKHKGNHGQDDASENGCKLKIQTSDKRSLTLTLKHDESFSTLLKACSQELNIPESKIKFYFDGELIEMEETPDTLDLEDEACIDCKISK